MKRILCILLTSVMLLSLLSGCSTKKEDKDVQPAANESSSKEQKDTKAKSEEKKEPVKIEWLAYQTSGQPDKESEIVKKVEEKFNADFEFWFIDDKKWDETLNVRLASGKMPDVLRVRNNSLQSLVEQGIVVELPIELIKEKAPNYYATALEFDPEGYIWNKTKLADGKNYAWPMIALDRKYHKVVQWRTDWLENVGISKIPETLEEFEEAMYAFRDKDPNKSGKNDTYGLSNKVFDAVFGAFGAPTRLERGDNYFVKDGKIEFAAIQPGMKDALATLNKWYEDGILDPEFITGENTGGYWALSHAFMNGRIGVTGFINYYHYLDWPGQEGPCYTELMGINPDAKVAIGAPPKGPNGQGVSRGSVAGEIIAITAKAMESEEKVDTILKMLDALYADEEYSMLTSYGLEGVHYELNDKGEINTLLKDPAKSREQGLHIFNFLTGSPEISYKFNKTKYDYADKNADYPGYAKPDLPSVKALSDNKETLRRIVEESYIEMITGEKSIDYFDEFVKMFNENGGIESLKALNEMYNSLK